jgi:hypothetical protein
MPAAPFSVSLAGGTISKAVLAVNCLFERLAVRAAAGFAGVRQRGDGA